MSTSKSRPIRRLLVTNRGEIATRIIAAARELGIETYAAYTGNDNSHIRGASGAIKLASSASYLNIQELVSVAKTNHVDAVHPGYGFLSESAEFATKMAAVGITVIGPGAQILQRTGDKLRAKQLADECSVPTLAALSTPTNDIETLKAFADRTGFPIMIKAVDGGGGRGIRLIRSPSELEGSAKRAIEESPSRQVFAEKAAVEGYLHVEIQIIGDGRGNVRHLWERQCSIQRRYQKVVEIAPCVNVDRSFMAEIIASALRMAKKTNYSSLGTFEFLANPTSREFFFLEINPRLQVEHTITESISYVDLVRAQLLLAQGASLSEAGFPEQNSEAAIAKPPLYSCQLRLTAENPAADWTLSIGKIKSFQLPNGNGIRVDTNLVSGQPYVVSADFDSLLAKIIVTASNWPAVVQKARRALADTQISGVKTNLTMLRGIAHHPKFAEGDCDTTWLERHQEELQRLGEKVTAALPTSLSTTAVNTSAATTSAVSSAPIMRPGDAWSLTFSPQGSTNPEQSQTHHLQVTRLLRNEFPSAVSANILYTTPASKPVPYSLKLTATTASASAATSNARKGDANNANHILNPFPGRLVELMVDVGDQVKEGDVIAIVQQMKMELEVRCRRGGVIGWVTEVEDGEEVAEGLLLAMVAEQKESRIDSKL